MTEGDAMLRTPPNNAEAERAVLGSILLDTTGQSEERVLDLCLTGSLVPDSFYDPRNLVIFQAMIDLNRLSKPLDPVTLREELVRSSKLEAAGGDGYLSSLMEQVPTTAHAEHYIAIVRSKHLRRLLIERASAVIKKCYDEGEFPDPQVVLGEAEKAFLEIGGTSGEMISWHQAVAKSFDMIDALFENRGDRIEGLSTGLKYLDEKLQGLKKSEMIVIAARPSVGKTSLAMNIAECCALGEDINGNKSKYDGGRPHPVAIFSLEMPIEALSKRMIAGRARINLWRLNRNLIAKEEKRNLTNKLTLASGTLKQAPIYVDDTAGLDIMDLRARARRMKKQHAIELIIIDYLQLCCCREGRRQGRQIEVSMISQQVKAMAKELKVPVIVLSQLSRANEQRGDKSERPKLSDLRDSGAIEQDADVVFLLRRPSRTEKDPEKSDERLAIIDVAKNRNGETGEVRANFDREFTRFGDRSQDKKDSSNDSSAEPPEDEKPVYEEQPTVVQGNLDDPLN